MLSSVVLFSAINYFQVFLASSAINYFQVFQVSFESEMALHIVLSLDILNVLFVLEFGWTIFPTLIYK